MNEETIKKKVVKMKAKGKSPRHRPKSRWE
jgi:hypothetical protein